MQKKILSLLLVTTMVVGTFAGCATAPSDPDTTETNSSETNTPETEEDSQSTELTDETEDSNTETKEESSAPDSSEQNGQTNQNTGSTGQTNQNTGSTGQTNQNTGSTGQTTPDSGNNSQGTTNNQPTDNLVTTYPTVDTITYLTMDNADKLKTVSDQMNALRTALDSEKNDKVAGRNENIAAVKQILTSAEALYFIVCTDNATMVNYKTMNSNKKYSTLGLYYMQALIDRYEEKRDFQTYFKNNYLGHHTGPAPEALTFINQNMNAVKGKNLTGLQQYAITVSKDLFAVFAEHNSNLETLFNYVDAYAEANPDDVNFQTNYKREYTDIDAYWDLIDTVKALMAK